MKAMMLMTTTFFMSLFWLALLGPIVVQPIAARPLLPPMDAQATLSPLLSLTPSDKALMHLKAVMDKCHQAFIIYEDLDSPCNHFPYQAKYEPETVAMDVSFTETVHSGSTAIKNTFNGQNWGGWVLQNGVLSPSATAPTANWGTYPDAGYDLTGATKLTFWARGETGAERVEFFAFGVGRNSSGQPIEPYPDLSITHKMGLFINKRPSVGHIL